MKYVKQVCKQFDSSTGEPKPDLVLHYIATDEGENLIHLSFWDLPFGPKLDAEREEIASRIIAALSDIPVQPGKNWKEWLSA